MNHYPSLQKRDDETAAAYQAFIDYVGMGWERSLEALLKRYETDKEAGIKPPTTRSSTLGDWSRFNHWQERLGQWREEVAMEKLENQGEYLSSNIDWILQQHAKLRKQIERMIERAQDLTVTKRTRVPDPRNPDQEIEVVYQRVNTRELKDLIAAYNDLGEKLRRQLGLKETVELELASVKPIIGFSPEEWADQFPNADNDSP